MKTSMAATLVAVLLSVTIAGCAIDWPTRSTAEPQPRLDDVLARMPAMLDAMHYQCAKIEMARDDEARGPLYRETASDAAMLRKMIGPLPKLTGFEREQLARVDSMTEELGKELDQVKALAEAGRIEELKRSVQAADGACQRLLAYIRWAR